MKRIFSWDFEGILPCHGRIIRFVLELAACIQPFWTLLWEELGAA